MRATVGAASAEFNRTLGEINAMDRKCVLLCNKIDSIDHDLLTITPDVTDARKLVKTLTEECSMLNGRMVNCRREVRKLHTAVNRDASTAGTTVAAVGTNATELLAQVKKMGKDLSVH